MNRESFLAALRQHLRSLPASELDEIIADYAAQFDEGLRVGRTEEEISQALGKPKQIARDYLHSSHLRYWQQSPSPWRCAAALLAAVGAFFLLPVGGVVMLAVLLVVLLVVLLLVLVLGGITALLIPLLPLILLAALISLLFRRRWCAVGSIPNALRAQAGDWITEHRDWQPQQAFTINGPYDVVWRPGEHSGATLEGPEEAIRAITLRSNGIAGKSAGANVKITLTSPAIRHWALIGSGDLVLEAVAQDVLEVELMGSGDILAGGHCQQLQVSLNGSGDIRLGKLTCQHATVVLHGSGDATVAPEKTADLAIYGSGDIHLARTPARVQNRIFGSGEIHSPPA